MSVIKSFGEWVEEMNRMVEQHGDLHGRCLGALDIMERVLAGRDQLDGREEEREVEDRLEVPATQSLIALVEPLVHGCRTSEEARHADARQDLAEALRIDVIPSKVYTLIAKTIEEQLGVSA